MLSRKWEKIWNKMERISFTVTSSISKSSVIVNNTALGVS